MSMPELPDLQNMSQDQALRLLEELMKKFDLKVESVADLSRRLKDSDKLCWYGASINAPSNIG
jgi:hypothetical protein